MDSWKSILDECYATLSAEYRTFLETDTSYFPNKHHYYNAFKTLPKNKVKYILFGQDPYPRQESAGGYAFIDEKVETLFCETGLSKEVNKATSLRNLLKMLLLEKDDLHEKNTTQADIAKVDKTQYINDIEGLRKNFEKNGVLLLNTALVFTDKKSSSKHIKQWLPFMQRLLKELQGDAPKLILFGSHAKALKKHLPLANYECIEMEHPYNHTFITNLQAHELFGSMHLLEK
jgi:uracil-DNA glycosylase